MTLRKWKTPGSCRVAVGCEIHCAVHLCLGRALRRLRQCMQTVQCGLYSLENLPGKAEGLSAVRAWSCRTSFLVQLQHDLAFVLALALEAHAHVKCCQLHMYLEKVRPLLLDLFKYSSRLIELARCGIQGTDLEPRFGRRRAEEDR